MSNTGTKRWSNPDNPGFTERTYGMMEDTSAREAARGLARAIGDTSMSMIDSLESDLAEAWEFEDPYVLEAGLEN